MDVSWLAVRLPGAVLELQAYIEAPSDSLPLVPSGKGEHIARYIGNSPLRCHALTRRACLCSRARRRVGWRQSVNIGPAHGRSRISLGSSTGPTSTENSSRRHVSPPFGTMKQPAFLVWSGDPFSSVITGLEPGGVAVWRWTESPV